MSNEELSAPGSVRPSLLVIYTQRLEECRRFYGELGLAFVTEQHGRGAQHYAAVLSDGQVFEIYPAREGRETGALRLGFTVVGTLTTPELATGRHLLTDPDGRAVEIYAT